MRKISLSSPVKEGVIQSRFSVERVVWRRVQLKGVQIAGVAGSILGGTGNRDMPRFLMMPCARSVSSQLAAYAGVTGF